MCVNTCNAKKGIAEKKKVLLFVFFLSFFLVKTKTLQAKSKIELAAHNKKKTSFFLLCLHARRGRVHFSICGLGII